MNIIIMCVIKKKIIIIISTGAFAYLLRNEFTVTITTHNLIRPIISEKQYNIMENTRKSFLGPL